MVGQKTLIFDIREIDYLIKQEIATVLGPESYSNDYSEIIRSIADNLLSNDIDYDRSYIYAMFFNYGLTQHDIEDIYPLLTMPMSRMLSGYITVSDTVIYDILVRYDGSMHVTAMPVPQQPDIHHDYYQDSIRRDIEAGHYIPEKIRRSVGY